MGIERLTKWLRRARLTKVQLPGGGWAVALILDGAYARESDAQYSLEEFLKETGIPLLPTREQVRAECTRLHSGSPKAVLS